MTSGRTITALVGAFLVSANAAAAASVPPRAGYYVGYRVATLAAHEYSLQRLAHLRGPAPLHRNINRWLDELVNAPYETTESTAHTNPVAAQATPPASALRAH